MKKTNVLLIAIVSVVLLALALLNRSDNSSSDAGNALLPNFSEQLGEVSSVAIFGFGKPESRDQVTLEKIDNRWGIAERNGYSATLEDVTKLLRNLADTVIVERKTNNPELYDLIGVEDLDIADAQDSTRQLIVKAGDTVLASLVIGNRDPRGSFMRKSGEATSWLVNREFMPPIEPHRWINKSLLAIPRERLAKIEMQPASGPAYEIISSGDSGDNFTLTPIPQGRELAAGAISRTTAALRSLTLADVRADTTKADNAAWTKSRWYTNDGLIISMESQKGSTPLARINATVDAERAGKALAKREEEAAAINQRTKGRLIEITAFQANNLQLELQQLLKPLPEPEAPAPAAPANDAPPLLEQLMNRG